MPRRMAALALSLVTASVVAVGPSASAAPGDEITLTFIRHAQSTGNASGFIDTSTPGPGLTELGWTQAHQVATNFTDTGCGVFDGVYASTMIRTQQTAQLLAEKLDEPVTVLPGLREIEAGVAEGRPETAAADYFGVLQQWIKGDRAARLPGSVDGNEFDARFDEAVATIYTTGDQRPVAFSHGGAIALWVLMNAGNADPDSLSSKPLNNTGYVVVRGSPTAGWTLTDWNGTRF